MDNLDAEHLLKYLSNLLINYLQELSLDSKNEFISGELTAYAECLEILQMWDKAKDAGLDFDVENKFQI